MKPSSLLLLLTAITLLSACTVRPANARHIHRVKAPVVVTSQALLDEEHRQGTLVIVSSQPKKSRHCHSHQDHWHCPRN